MRAALSSAVLLAAHAATAPGQLDITPGAWPLEGTVDEAKALAAAVSTLRPTGLTKADYLRVSNGVVQGIRPFQAANGTIIDPYRMQETQYATPCWANAASLAYTQGLDDTLLANATAALSAALYELANNTCADGHDNFFTKPVTYAYLRLKDVVPTALVAQWNASMAAINPANDYHNLAENWGIVALAGEYLRTMKAGFGDPSWWQGELATQVSGTLITGNGLYQDHSGSDGLNPLPYDTFPTSGYFTPMLREGYNGTYAPYLAEITKRAAWTHMAMQSPWGEIPTGGRSGQHQWNEAVSALAYEIFAAQYTAAGDVASACLFKRAAHLSLASVARWQNPSGVLQIVKNHFDPALRFGYEVYSFLTNYNDLPASMLSAAFEYADDTVPECAAFSEVGGFVFQLPEHHLIIANAGGTYLEIETAADPHYDSSGLHRVHINTCGTTPSGQSCTAVHPLLGPTAGPPQEEGGIGLGPWWTLSTDAPGTVRSLGNMTYADITAAVLTPLAIPSAGNVMFQVDYVLLAQGTLVTQVYNVTGAPYVPSVSVVNSITLPGARALLQWVQDKQAAGGDVRFNASAVPTALAAAAAAGVLESTAAVNVTRMGMQLPVFLFDGVTNTSAVVGSSGANNITIAGPTGSGWGSITYGVLTGSGAALPITYSPSSPLPVPTRNGYMGMASASAAVATTSPALILTITGASE